VTGEDHGNSLLTGMGGLHQPIKPETENTRYYTKLTAANNTTHK